MTESDLHMFNRALEKALVDDCDRLRAEVERQELAIAGMALITGKLEAEVERLKAEVRYWKGHIPVQILQDFPFSLKDPKS